MNVDELAELAQGYRDEDAAVPHEVRVCTAAACLSSGGQSVLDAVIRNTQLTVTLQAATGTPYTPTLSFYGGWSNRAEQNSGRGPATMRIDALAAKDFLLANLRVAVFLRVVNLLDQRVCQQVFASSGRCDTGTVDRGRVPYRTVSELTSTFFDRPHYYGPRRSFNFGMRMQF